MTINWTTKKLYHNIKQAHNTDTGYVMMAQTVSEHSKMSVFTDPSSFCSWQ